MEVTLKIYDIVVPRRINSIATSVLGLGVYHTSLKIKFHEYYFSQDDGIQKSIEEFYHRSGQGQQHHQQLRSQEVIGIFHGSEAEFEEILRDLSEDFTSDSYDVLHRNCNHFTESLCLKLFGYSKVPSYINRAASIASYFSKSKDSSRKNTLQKSTALDNNDDEPSCPEEEKI